MVEIIIILVVVATVWFFFFRGQSLLVKHGQKIKTAEKENTDVKYTYSLKEIELIDLINYHRTSLGLSKLKINNYVTSKCLQHNADMILAGEVSHSGFVDRSENIVRSLGVKSTGENIAYGYTAPSSIFKAWLKSSSHKENLEDFKWTEMGLSITDKYITNIFIC